VGCAGSVVQRSDYIEWVLGSLSASGVRGWLRRMGPRPQSAWAAPGTLGTMLVGERSLNYVLCLAALAGGCCLLRAGLPRPLVARLGFSSLLGLSSLRDVLQRRAVRRTAAFAPPNPVCATLGTREPHTACNCASQATARRVPPTPRATERPLELQTLWPQSPVSGRNRDGECSTEVCGAPSCVRRAPALRTLSCPAGPLLYTLNSSAAADPASSFVSTAAARLRLVGIYV
jgi:hypothetical protein